MKKTAFIFISILFSILLTIPCAADIITDPNGHADFTTTQAATDDANCGYFQSLDWAIAVPGWLEQVSSSGWRSHELDSDSIAMDVLGNTYVTGTFWGTIDFDPSPETFNLTSERYGVFVAKYDDSGNLLWAIAVPGWLEQLSSNSWRSHEVYATNMTLDTKGNIYITGAFRGTIDFDPSPETFNLTSERNSMFVAKYDDSGNLLWVIAVLGWDEQVSRGGWRSNGVSAANMTLDTKGNIYITGDFWGTIDFDPSAETFNLTSERAGMFVAKYDDSGNLLWAMAVPSWDEQVSNGWISYEVSATNMTLDTKGNIYITGDFYGTIDFDPSAETFSLTSEQGSMFVAKYDDSVNLLWAIAVPCWNEQVSSYGWISHVVFAKSIAMDALGNTYVTGVFRGTIDFDPSPETFNLTSERYGMFVAKYDDSGNLLWAIAVPGWYEQVSSSLWRSHVVYADDMTLDTKGNIYITGAFRGTIDFDPGPETFNLTSEGDGMFVACYSSAGEFVCATSAGGLNGRELPYGCGGRRSDFAIAVYADKKILVTGSFWGNLEIDIGLDTVELNSERNGMFILSYWLPIEAKLRITPQTINRNSRQSKIRTLLKIADVTKDQIAEEPLILLPGDIESMSQYVFEHGRKGHKRTSIFAFFSKADLLAAVGDNGKVQVFVIGRLTNGQYFYGTDTIRIKTNNLEYLAILTYHWLRTDCKKPHWCEGSDINQDGTINFIDFALFDGCCLEFIKN